MSLLTYVLTTRAERERRPPSIAIAWVLGLIAMPYIALPMYLLFGRRKLKRKAAPQAGICPESKHWAEHLIESFGLPAAAPALVRMHQNGIEARAALFELMSRAHEQLDICTFILGEDAFGEEATAAMMACAARGVRVRFLIDGVCAIHLPKSWFARLRDAGVQTAVFSPLLARTTPGPRNLRNHRKWAVADATILWAGGRNLAAEYFCGDDGVPPWLDLSFDLKGPVAASAAAQFEADWAAAAVARRIAARGGRAVDGQVVTGQPTAGQPFTPIRRAACRRPRPVPAERARPVRGHGICPARRCLFPCHTSHSRGHALLPAGRGFGSGLAPGRTARRENRFAHSGQVQSSTGRLCAQSIAARAGRCGGVSSPVAHHESCQGGGIRSQHRPVRLSQSRLAQSSAQL